MITWRLGTMGFGYDDWQGVFYPQGMPKHAYLGHYSRFFNTVELDTTFYGAPRPGQAARWARATPDDFIFAAKLPRQITHELRLVLPGAETELYGFLQEMQPLQPKLSTLLIQLPPDFTPAEAENLTRFTASLPKDIRFAVEFRHSEWYQPDIATQVATALRRHNVCWAATDYLELPRQVIPTTNFLYVRFIGVHGRYDCKDHERLDLTPRLREWIIMLEPHLTGPQTVFGFFNNDYAGHSPATCNRFKTLVGLPTEDLLPPQQGRLF